MFMAIAVVLNTRVTEKMDFCLWTLFHSSANTPSWASCLSFEHAELLLGTSFIVFNFS